MTEIGKETELAVRMTTAPAAMAQLIATVGMARVETLANCSYHDRHGAVMLLITSDPLRAAAELEAAHFHVAVNAVVLVRAAYEPQLAIRLGRRLSAAGIQVLYSYVSWTEGHRAYLVLKTTDDERAVSLLRAEMLVHDVAREKTVAHEREPAEHLAA